MRQAGAVVLSSPAREKVPSSPGLPGILAGSGTRSRSRSAGSSNCTVSSCSRSVGRSSAATQATMVAAAEEGEPSSPKVTCIGQVRMRNKKPPAEPAAPRGKGDAGAPRQCFRRALLRSLLPARRKPTAGGGSGGGAVAARARSLWRGWAALGSGRSGGKCRYQRREPDSPGTPPDKAENEEETSAAVTLPKNAHLLTRCRSVPQQSSPPSSIPATARCAVSPLPTGGASGRDVSVKEPAELGSSWKRNKEKRDMAEAEEEEEEEEEGMVSESQRAPLVLTRCRSEPAARRRAA